MAKLDKIDLKMLDLLCRDGRIKKLDLAAAVGLSTAACWERLRRLETTGIIEGYGARLNSAIFGPVTTVIVEIVLRRHQAPDFRSFETYVERLPEIVACDAVGGGIDYVLRVVSADLSRYQQLIDHLLLADIGVDRYFSYIVTKPVKNTQLPLKIATLPIDVDVSK